MSIIEYMTENSPITNLPDLLNWGHDNPLGLSMGVELGLIFVITLAMALINHGIRKQGKSNWYGYLYALFGIDVAATYYYAFQNGLPRVFLSGFGVEKPCIGWFCQPDMVGWAWAIVGIICLAFVVYSLLCAVMQIVAQLTVDAHLTKGKVWKEWKGCTYLALLGVAACGVSYFAGAAASSWTLLVCQGLLLLAVLVKMIADCCRMEHWWCGVGIALVYYIGILAIVMLTVECMKGALALFVVLLVWFTSAKASKKDPKKKEKKQ